MAVTEDVGADAIALATIIERSRSTEPPAPFSRDQVNMVVEMLRKCGEEILRLRSEKE